MNAIKPFLARLLAPWVAAALLWIGARVGHQYDADLIAEATMWVVEIVSWSAAILLTLYGLAHRALSRRFNPADVAARPRDIPEPRVHEVP